MININALSDILTQKLTLNKSRINCLALMILALIQCQSGNLKKVAQNFVQGKKIDSNYRRIQRFLQQVTFDYDEIAKFLYNLFNLNKVTISIDRTNWKWGQRNINIFMLSIVYKGIAIPIFWDLLDKRGNSNTTERKKLLNKFINCFGDDKIEYVLADREFVGKEWFTWLNDMGIKFCIRIKKNSLVNNTSGEMVQVHTLFRNVNKQECFINLRTVTIDGCKVKLSAKRNSDNELVIVATNDLKCLHSIDLYKKRWQIETLFSCFKSRGFGLEDTHLTDQSKMKKLIAIFSIAFCWCYKIGIKQRNEKPITIKNHGRASKSLFRLGLDFFQEKFRAVLLFSECDYFDWLIGFLMIDINTIPLISKDN